MPAGGRSRLHATAALLALLASLLGLCPCAPPAEGAESHDCCTRGEGAVVRAALTDCCAGHVEARLEPGTLTAPPPVASPAVLAPVCPSPPRPPHASLVSTAAWAVPPAAASPPSVLRI